MLTHLFCIRTDVCPSSTTELNGIHPTAVRNGDANPCFLLCRPRAAQKVRCTSSLRFKSVAGLAPSPYDSWPFRQDMFISATASCAKCRSTAHGSTLHGTFLKRIMQTLCDKIFSPFVPPCAFAAPALQSCDHCQELAGVESSSHWCPPFHQDLCFVLEDLPFSLHLLELQSVRASPALCLLCFDLVCVGKEKLRPVFIDDKTIVILILADLAQVLHATRSLKTVLCLRCDHRRSRLCECLPSPWWLSLWHRTSSALVKLKCISVMVSATDSTLCGSQRGGHFGSGHGVPLQSPAFTLHSSTISESGGFGLGRALYTGRTSGTALHIGGSSVTASWFT